MWDTTIRKLHAIRQEIMTGMSNLEMRQAVWEKQYWKCADEEADQKLMFEEVEKQVWEFEDGVRVIRNQKVLSKIRDDNTRQIAEVFRQWLYQHDL